MKSRYIKHHLAIQSSIIFCVTLLTLAMYSVAGASWVRFAFPLWALLTVYCNGMLWALMAALKQKEVSNENSTHTMR